MIRSAAKNHAYVAVCTEPEDYAEVLAALTQHGGATTLALRQRLAARAFARTAAYDAAISDWFAGAAGDDVAPAYRAHRRRAGADDALRREPAPERRPSTPPPTRARRRHRAPAAGQGALLQQHQRHRRGLRTGRRVRPGRSAACAIIKHANPCGVRRGREPARRLRAGAGVRSGLGLRRHRRAQPPARRGGRARSPRSSPRW